MPVMPPKDQAALQKMVMAGKKIMYDKKVFPMLEQGMQGDKPTDEKLAMEAAGLVKLLNDRAQGTLPVRLLIPAAMMLMLEMADFMQKSGMAEITQQDIQGAMQMLVKVMNQVFGGKGQAPEQPAQQQAQQPAPPPQSQQGGLIQQPAPTGA